MINTKKTKFGKGRYCYLPLLDIEMGQKPYQRIHFDLYMKILKELDSEKRYKDILSQFPKAEISKMTISNIFKSINIRDLNKDSQYQINTGKIKFNSNYLYVEVDDTYTNLFEKHKQISKKNHLHGIYLYWFW